MFWGEKGVFDVGEAGFVAIALRAVTEELMKYDEKLKLMKMFALKFGVHPCFTQVLEPGGSGRKACSTERRPEKTCKQVLCEAQILNLLLDPGTHHLLEASFAWSVTLRVWRLIEPCSLFIS